MAAPVKIYNNIKVATATTGTGTATLGSAVTGFFNQTEAGIADGDVIPYRIDDGNDFEIGVGTYTASGTTLSRDTVTGSKIGGTAGTSKINLSGSATVSLVVTAAQHAFQSFSVPTNFSLAASVSSNILTVALKDGNGNDATEGSPVLIPFRNSTIATGTPIWRRVAAALSVTTNATGASLGTVGTVPFRLWVVAFDDSGTVRLALWQSTTSSGTAPNLPTALTGLDEGNVASATGFSGSAATAGTFYCSNGVTITSKSFRILGYLDYASGLTTAGTYASGPTTIQLFGPGIHKPGDTVGFAYGASNSSSSTASSNFQSSNITASMVVVNACNLVLADWSLPLETATGTVADAIGQLFRGSTALGYLQYVDANLASKVFGTVAGVVLDAPQAAGSTTYTVKYRNDDNATRIDACPASIPGGSVTLQEIMR